jgi:two-component system chemotaxis response regulator CheY
VSESENLSVMDLPEAPPAPDTPRILVVDDATVVRLYYRQVLEQAGYRIDDAINGLEALEKVLQAPYDLCVVDVNMPLMDGYAFIRALRAQARTGAIPTLMTTTEAGPRDHQEALAAGANIYLVKPVAQEKLALYVAALLGRAPA